MHVFPKEGNNVYKCTWTFLYTGCIRAGIRTRNSEICVNGEYLCQHKVLISHILLNFFKRIKKQIGHHATPRRASATAPLRTGADTCKTGSGAGKRSGAKSDPVRRRSNRAWTEDQAGKSKACQHRRGQGLAGAHRSSGRRT